MIESISKQLFHKLTERLKKTLTELSIIESDKWCSFSLNEGKKFAYILLTKQKPKIEIWCLGNVDEIKQKYGKRIKFKTRKETKGGFGIDYQINFVVENSFDIENAVLLLSEISNERARSNWTREQTIVALRTYFSVPFNKANNSNREIIRIAKIIRRGVNSVKMKIGNFGSLDPELDKRGIVGLSGSSNLDRAVWNEFNKDREKLAFESTALIAKFSNKNIEQVIDLKEEEIKDGKEKLRLIKTRVNQYFFRDSILGIYDSKCCITGLSIPILLVASHIIPWADDQKNRLNPENGLCLNSIHDRAFDEGLITVTTDYKVKLSKALLDFNKDDTVKKFFKDYEGTKIVMPERYFPNKKFLDYHNTEIFIK